MPEDPAGARLILLGTAAEVDDGRLAALYTYPAYPEYPDRTWVRANFITSLDGGATVGGTSGGLAGPGDRVVFGLLRELADVIVVGAGTVRTENYAGAHLSVRQRQNRADRGQSEVPALAIVTRSGRLAREMAVFTRTEVPPLVLTCSAAIGEARPRLAGVADVIDCSDIDPGHVDMSAALAALAARGLCRVLTEGGPALLGSFIEHDLLDELCLTIAPIVVGGQAPRIATGPVQALTRMRRGHILTDDAGYLYTRYVKDR